MSMHTSQDNNYFHLTHTDEQSFYQNIVRELLAIKGYSENVLSLGANISIEMVCKLRKGNITQLDYETLGRLLKFYNKIFYECHLNHPTTHVISLNLEKSYETTTV